MNDLSTTNGGGSLLEVPEISPSMRNCLARVKTIARYGTDDNPRDSAEFDAGEWIAPTWVSESLRDEAARLLPVYERAAFTVPDQTFQRWLNVLWLGLPKANGGAEKWEAIKLVYAAMLDDFPAACFNKRTMREARDRFRFFPGTNELAGFLTKYRTEAANAVYRLRVIAHTTTQRPNWTAAQEDRPKKTEQELRHVADLCATIRENLAHGPAKGSGKGPVAGQGAMKTAYKATGIKSKDVRESQPAEAEAEP
jgi:hypothetical protein